MMVSYKERLEGEAEEEEEASEEDEVFGPHNNNSVNKPLMAPRRRSDALHTRVRRAPPPLQLIWGPLCYGVTAISTLVGLIFLVIFLVRMLMSGEVPLQLQEPGPPPAHPPCSQLSVSEVWARTFPMLTTETAIRLADLNKDGTDDIVMGFGTGADAFSYPAVVCEVYFGASAGGDAGCGGGVLALDGRSGLEMWRRYSPHELFALLCTLDIDRDGIVDCVAAGRMAGLLTISGRDGSVLWKFTDSLAKVEASNVYTPVYIRDLDSDGVPDLLAAHGGDPLKEPGSSTPRLIGRLLLVSGKTGQVLQWMEVPDGKETYYSPQVHTLPDGTEMVIFGTGGETNGGSLWLISLADLVAGRMDGVRALYTDPHKGVMTPPVLVDLTGDGVNDLVMAMFNSTVRAFDGRTFKPLWTYHIPSSESYSTPGAGFYNNDSVPDFIINYQTGPGFPIYYYTQTTVLDGTTGQPLIPKPIKMVVGTQSSPLVVSIDGYGNDIFLYWVSDCHGDQSQKDLQFNFVKGTSVHEQSRADLCKQRFKEKLSTRFHALTSHSSLPGVLVYDSDQMRELEIGRPINYTAIGQAFLRAHPQYWQDYYHAAHPADDYPDYGRSDGQDDYLWVHDEPPHRHRRPPTTRRKQLSPPPEWNRHHHGPGGNFRRVRRHVGPHDAGGIQRVISTGTLAPPLGATSRDDPTSSIDVVFATFWFYPSDATTLLPADMACIQELMAQEPRRFQPHNAFYGMDHDAYEEAVTKECLLRTGHSDEISSSQREYDPFNRPMGQMTVYRRRISCECKKEEKPCARVLPFNQQGWPAYLGARGDCLFKPRP